MVKETWRCWTISFAKNLVSSISSSLIFSLLTCTLEIGISKHNLETTLLWWRNKPQSYVNAMTPEQKSQLYEEARRNLPTQRAIIQQKKASVQQELAAKLAAKHAKAHSVEEKQRSVKLKATKEVGLYGGPWELSELDEKVVEYDHCLRKALICQLKFNRDVLQCQGRRNLFHETTGGRPVPVSGLLENLREVLMLNESGEEAEVATTTLTLRDASEMDEEIELKKKEVKKKLEVARKARQAKKAKELLPKFLDDPSLLVQSRVLHNCCEDGAAAQWYPATVLGIAVERNAIQTLFTIGYEDEEGTYDFSLLSDLKKGDLILL